VTDEIVSDPVVRDIGGGHDTFDGHAASAEVRHLPRKAVPETVTFDRNELRDILNLYGRKVAEGEWRDYAIDFSRETATFSVFRRASEFPIYRIVKTPKLARKQGAFSVVTTTGLILKRGHDLRRVLEVLDKKLKLVAL
jgi:hypothetical protein